MNFLNLSIQGVSQNIRCVLFQKCSISEAHRQLHTFTPGSSNHGPLHLHTDKHHWSMWGLRVRVKVFVQEEERVARRISPPVWDYKYSLSEPHLMSKVVLFTHLSL